MKFVVSLVALSVTTMFCSVAYADPVTQDKNKAQSENADKLKAYIESIQGQKSPPLKGETGEQYFLRQIAEAKAAARQQRSQHSHHQ